MSNNIKESYSPTFKQKLISLLSLTIVSTLIGIGMKLSQKKGKYEFSPASVVVMTELYKLIATLGIIFHLSWVKENSLNSEKNPLFNKIFHMLTENVTLDLIKSQFILSLVYTFVNVVTFPIFTYMSASMFFLLKAASPIITAIILRIISHRLISKLRWFAIAMQCLGLFITQVNFCNGSTTISIIGYILVVSNIISSCLAGVYNEKIIKTHQVSLNTQNFFLYLFGVIFNTILHFILPPEFLGITVKPGFFDGYYFTTLLIIISNGSVGLVISAVYKYADVLVKTFGVASSTSLLFTLESFGLIPKERRSTSLSVTLCGAILIFYASYVYILPETENNETPIKLEEKGNLKEEEEEEEEKKNVSKLPLNKNVIKNTEELGNNIQTGKVFNHGIGLVTMGVIALSLVFLDYGVCFY